MLVQEIQKTHFSCFGFNSRGIKQFLGDLPKEIMKLFTALSKIGKSFAGPLFYKDGKTQKKATEWFCLLIIKNCAKSLDT